MQDEDYDSFLLVLRQRLNWPLRQILHPRLPPRPSHPTANQWPRVFAEALNATPKVRADWVFFRGVEAIAAEQRAAMDKRFVERSSAAISPLALLSMSSLSSSSSSSSSSLPSVHGGDEDDEDDLLFDRQLDELTVVQDELRRKCSSWIKEAPRGPTAAHGAIGYSGGRGYRKAYQTRARDARRHE